MLLAFLATLLAHPAPTPDLYVDQNAPACVTGTGTAADPVCSIAAAVALASPGDTIRIAPGTYVENLTLPFDLDLVGSGGESVTFLDGGAPAIPLPGRVLTIPGAVTVAIDGVTIRNGHIQDNGGGIRVDGALVLSNSTVCGNRSDALGGGIYGGPGADILIEGCTIQDNHTFSDYTQEFAQGGGVSVMNADLSVLDSRILDNSAYHDTLDAGCGILSFGKGGGGISFRSTGDLLIANSTIARNSANCDGGGLVLLGSGPSIQVTNTTISGNLANYGAGVLATGFTFEHVTVTENLAAGSGYGMPFQSSGQSSGVSAYGDASGQVVRNSIIAGNLRQTSGPGVAVPHDARGDFSSLGHNLVGLEPTPGTGFVDGVGGDKVGSAVSPLPALLGPLADEGGATEVHAPLLGSPAIDMADPLAFEAFDQRGLARPVGAGPDIGAVEVRLSDFSHCNGDGGDQMGCTNCPCGNNAPPGTVGGCLNSSGNGARLSASGSTSVSLPPMIAGDLRFALSGGPAGALCVLLSGSQLAPENPANPCFALQSGVRSIAFDGLRCAILNLRRHGSRTTDGAGLVGSSNAPWGGEGGPPLGIAQAFGGFSAGQTRFFQAIHRDDALTVCMRGLNTSQALEVVFTP